MVFFSLWDVQGYLLHIRRRRRLGKSSQKRTRRHPGGMIHHGPECVTSRSVIHRHVTCHPRRNFTSGARAPYEIKIQGSLWQLVDFSLTSDRLRWAKRKHVRLSMTNHSCWPIAYDPCRRTMTSLCTGTEIAERLITPGLKQPKQSSRDGHNIKHWHLFRRFLLRPSVRRPPKKERQQNSAWNRSSNRALTFRACCLRKLRVICSGFRCWRSQNCVVLTLDASPE